MALVYGGAVHAGLLMKTKARALGSIRGWLSRRGAIQVETISNASDVACSSEDLGKPLDIQFVIQREGTVEHNFYPIMKAERCGCP